MLLVCGLAGMGGKTAERKSVNAHAAWLTSGWHAAGTVAVLSAGTADESVAEECRVIADFMGCYTFKLPDVSVDGLHRILHNLPGLDLIFSFPYP